MFPLPYIATRIIKIQYMYGHFYKWTNFLNISFYIYLFIACGIHCLKSCVNNFLWNVIYILAFDCSLLHNVFTTEFAFKGGHFRSVQRYCVNSCLNNVLKTEFACYGDHFGSVQIYCVNSCYHHPPCIDRKLNQNMQRRSFEHYCVSAT
jgi:hypothetical protein